MHPKGSHADQPVASAIDGAALFRGLERKLRSILDREMRRHVVLECLESAQPWEVHFVIHQTLSSAHDGHPVRVLLRELLLDVLSSDGEPPSRPGLSYARRRELYEIALELGDEVAAAPLRSLPRSEPDEALVARVPKELEELSLGMRRSLAKGDDPQRIEQLSRDPDPIVMRNLLRNPRLREEDVVRIAALRPVPESTLFEIAHSPRWSKQPRVRATLARNPHTPVDLGIKLIVTLPLTTLREMQGDPDLHPEVHQRIEDEIALRMSSR